jgi:hypothetical protein
MEYSFLKDKDAAFFKEVSDNKEDYTKEFLTAVEKELAARNINSTADLLDAVHNDLITTNKKCEENFLNESSKYVKIKIPFIKLGDSCFSQCIVCGTTDGIQINDFKFELLEPKSMFEKFVLVGNLLVSNEVTVEQTAIKLELSECPRCHKLRLSRGSAIRKMWIRYFISIIFISTMAFFVSYPMVNIKPELYLIVLTGVIALFGFPFLLIKKYHREERFKRIPILYHIDPDGLVFEYDAESYPVDLTIGEKITDLEELIKLIQRKEQSKIEYYLV